MLHNLWNRINMQAGMWEQPPLKPCSAPLGCQSGAAACPGRGAGTLASQLPSSRPAALREGIEFVAAVPSWHEHPCSLTAWSRPSFRCRCSWRSCS